MKHSSWGCQHESFCSLIWAGAKTINWPYPLGWFKKLLKVTKSYTLLLEHVCLFYMRWHDMKHSSWGCQHESLFACSLIWTRAKTVNWQLDTSRGFTPAPPVGTIGTVFAEPSRGFNPRTPQWSLVSEFWSISRVLEQQTLFQGSIHCSVSG